jgi:hypothetical protein
MYDRNRKSYKFLGSLLEKIVGRRRKRKPNWFMKPDIA